MYANITESVTGKYCYGKIYIYMLMLSVHSINNQSAFY